MRSPISLVSLAFAAAPLAAQAPALRPALRDSFVAVSAPVVALNHVRVVDGTGAPPADDQTIVIAGGRIQAVGKFGAVAVPQGAQVMDLSGHTVIPGITTVVPGRAASISATRSPLVTTVSPRRSTRASAT